MPSDMGRGFWRFFDDFETATIGTTSVTTGYRWASSADAGDTAFAPSAVAGVGTAARATTAATDANMVELAWALLPFRAQDGEMHMEARVKIDVITNVRLVVGFSDDSSEDTNNPPITISGTTPTTNASTAACWVFDTDQTTDNWHVFWVDDDTNSLQTIGTSSTGDSQANVGIAPVAATYETLGVHIYDAGSGNQTRMEFSRNGRVYKTIVSGIDRDALMTVGVWMQNASATVHIVDVDYIDVWGSRVA